MLVFVLVQAASSTVIAPILPIPADQFQSVPRFASELTPEPRQTPQATLVPFPVHSAAPICHNPSSAEGEGDWVDTSVARIPGRSPRYARRTSEIGMVDSASTAATSERLLTMLFRGVSEVVALGTTEFFAAADATFARVVPIGLNTSNAPSCISPEPETNPNPPSPTPRPVVAPRAFSITGLASWYCKAGVSICHHSYPPGSMVAAACGKLRRAIGADWRGKVVTVKGPNTSVQVQLVDWCGSETKLIDLYWAPMSKLGGTGVLPVTVSW